ncbi:MAG: large repetitive protein [Solirubrobacteraceae bacterium]|nr:large repetitive protein [Solirubrobacteraceae bacterium]
MSHCCGDGQASKRRARSVIAAATMLIAAAALAAPAGASVTSTDHALLINSSNQNTDLTVSGVSDGATGVSVTLTDGTTTLTSTATLDAGLSSWSASFPSAGVRTLKDGVLTAIDTYTVPGPTPADPPAVVSGAALDIAKDTVAPSASTATPGTGTYTGTRQVTLTSADATASIHFTTDGAVPTAADSTPAGGQVAVATSMRLRAVAIDPAGNAGPTATFDYVINQPVVTPPSAPPVTNPGATTTPPTPDAAATPATTAATGASGGSTPAQAAAAISPLAVPAPVAPVAATTAPAVGIVSVTGRLTTRSLRRQGLRIGMRLNPGTKVVSVRIYRVRKGKSAGAPVVSAQSFPAAAGGFAVALKPGQVKGLRAGRYLVQVRAGGASSALGRATNVLIAVRR